MAEYLVNCLIDGSEKSAQVCEETGVIYVDWMFLFLWLTEGRGKFQGKVGSQKD